MEIFGRPNLPTGLAQQLIAMRAQQPNHWAEAIKAVGDTVTSKLEHEANLEAADKKLKAQKSVIDYLQHHIGLRNKETKMMDIIKEGVHEGTLTNLGDQIKSQMEPPGGQMPWGQLPASTAAGPVGLPPIRGGGAVPLQQIFEAMGLRSPAGAAGLGFGAKRVTPKAQPTDVVPLSSDMIQKFKPILDLSGREGTPVKISTMALMNDMISGKGKYKGAGGKVDDKRKTAMQMAFREHMSLQDEATYNPSIVVPDINERTDYYEKVLRDQGDDEEGGGLSDILMKSLMGELSK